MVTCDAGNTPKPPRESPDTAVCVLGSADLIPTIARSPRVICARPLATPNLGIERIVRYMLATPEARHLVVCGQDLRLFRPGQALVLLSENGLRKGGGEIVGASKLAHLPTLTSEDIEAFRDKVWVHDRVGDTNSSCVLRLINSLPRIPPKESPVSPASERVEYVSVGHSRRPISDSNEGYVVVELEHQTRRIVLDHVAPDLSRTRRLCHHSAAALAQSAVSHGFVQDPFHAAYLGAELAKAECALRFDLKYRQDRPLRDATYQSPDHSERTE